MSRALGAAALATTTAASALTACGSDDNRPSASATTLPGPAGAVSCAGKNVLTAEGSTAQQNAIAVFNQVWGQYCPGKSVAYNPTGSGAGREQFIAGHVDFAGTDSPLASGQLRPAAKRCNGNPAWDLPLAFGPVALVYKLPGVRTLIVNADVLAKIFSGTIIRWNDPMLAALNGGVALPDTKITPIYRSDSSGTTDSLQRYLMTAAPRSWTRGVGTEFQGGAGEGVLKSAGVIQAVRTTPGAIGYVEKGDDVVLDLDPVYATQQPGSYPLVLATYQVVCSKGYNPETFNAIKSFLSVAVNNGQNDLSSAGYVPLPDKVKERVAAAINAMQ